MREIGLYRGKTKNGEWEEKNWNFEIPLPNEKLTLNI